MEAEGTAFPVWCAPRSSGNDPHLAPRHYPASIEQGIQSYGRSMQKGPGVFDNFTRNMTAHCINDTLLRRVRHDGHLTFQGFSSLVVIIDQISECAANIDPDARRYKLIPPSIRELRVIRVPGATLPPLDCRDVPVPVTRLWPAPPQALGKAMTKFGSPSASALRQDDDGSLGEEEFDIP